MMWMWIVDPAQENHLQCVRVKFASYCDYFATYFSLYLTLALLPQLFFIELWYSLGLNPVIPLLHQINFTI